MKLIGLAGTNGSGKDSVGHALAKNQGYLFISVTDILREQLLKDGRPTERENMRELSAQWRRENGLGVLVDKAVEMFSSQAGKYQGLAVSSLRNPGEADRVHELGGKVVWVDADPKVRFDRIQGRGRVDDDKTFEEFLAEEEAEMRHSGDEATLNMSDVRERADVTIENSGNDLELFEGVVTKTLEKIV
jgi:dephospho-CoA kinase